MIAVLDDSASEVSTIDFESEAHSAPSSDHAHSPSPHLDLGSPTTPRADKYPSASAVRRAKAAAKGLSVGNEAQGGATQSQQQQQQQQQHSSLQGRGMPASPRPEPTRAG